MQQVPQQFISLVAFAAAVVVTASRSGWDSTFNPWHLEPQAWVAGLVAVRGAIALYNFLVLSAFERLLPTRDPSRPPVRYVGLDGLSAFYLALNAVNEWAQVQHITHYLWYADAVPMLASDVTLLNTAAALYVMFIANDVLYAPAHWFLHWPSVYPYVHN